MALIFKTKCESLSLIHSIHRSKTNQKNMSRQISLYIPQENSYKHSKYGPSSIDLKITHSLLFPIFIQLERSLKAKVQLNRTTFCLSFRLIRKQQFFGRVHLRNNAQIINDDPSLAADLCLEIVFFRISLGKNLEKAMRLLS